MIHLTMHVHFYNIKYMNPQSIILSIGGVAFFRIDLLNYLTTRPYERDGTSYTTYW